jgi:hypothetical protein
MNGNGIARANQNLRDLGIEETTDLGDRNGTCGKLMSPSKSVLNVAKNLVVMNHTSLRDSREKPNTTIVLNLPHSLL